MFRKKATPPRREWYYDPDYERLDKSATIKFEPTSDTKTFKITFLGDHPARKIVASHYSVSGKHILFQTVKTVGSYVTFSPWQGLRANDQVEYHDVLRVLTREVLSIEEVIDA